MITKLTNEEARRIAGLLASIDKEAEKAMEPIIQGKRDANEILSLLRRVVKVYLYDKDKAARVKATVKVELQAWAATYGLQTKKEEVFTARYRVNLTEKDSARLLAAVGDEKKIPDFLRAAVMAAVAEVEQSKKRGRAA